MFSHGDCMGFAYLMGLYVPVTLWFVRNISLIYISMIYIFSFVKGSWLIGTETLGIPLDDSNEIVLSYVSDMIFR